MTSFSTALENFIFRGLNFFGEAKRAEYWMILPLVWLAILGMVYLDIRQVWGQLLVREIPSLNPVHYGAPMLFAITLLPRYALTVRRLNDAGRSPRWALLPLKATILSVVTLIGLASAALTAGLQASEEAVVASALTGAALLAVFSSDAAWEVVFAGAQVLQTADLWSLAGSMSLPDISQIVQNITASHAANPEIPSAVMLVALGMIFGPFIIMAFFLFLMILPSAPGVDSFDRMSGSHRASLDRPSKAMASYAILAKLEEERRNPQVAAARRDQGREDVRSLYQSRVLGNKPQP